MDGMTQVRALNARVARLCDLVASLCDECGSLAQHNTHAIAVHISDIAAECRAEDKGETGDARPKSERGLYGKYRVERRDGTDQPGGKHDGCAYFVLDLTHDPFAAPAIRAYASACAGTYPALAADLLSIVGKEGHHV